MKTSVFINKLNEINYSSVSYQGMISIIPSDTHVDNSNDARQEAIIRISEVESLVMNSNTEKLRKIEQEVQIKIFKIASEYCATSLYDRKDDYQYELISTFLEGNRTSLIFDYHDETYRFDKPRTVFSKWKFTGEEIENSLPEWVGEFIKQGLIKKEEIE